METSSKTLLIFISLHFYYFSFHLINAVIAADVDHPYAPLENIALDCGSSFDSQTLSFDGRNWTGDVGSKFTAFNSHSNSTLSTASFFDEAIGIPEVPYKTARLFYSKFTYTFNVTPGPKFVRLHFYPSSYSGLNASRAFLSVIDGDNRTLLSNFSATLAANYKNVDTFFKEFIIEVQNHSLCLTFSPSSNESDAFAFVNGIEVVSMPMNLYIKGEDVPLPFVGYPAMVITLDNKSALETVYRINVAGADISPKHDSGMFRTWIKDDPYIFGSAKGERAFDLNLSIRYTSAVPEYTAPQSVYRTARYMGNSPQINLNFNLSWYFSVETGFKYLVRLHFCEVARYITRVNQRVFRIYINNQTAEDQADIFGWSGGQGVPLYNDYIIMVPELSEMNIQDLWLELHPNSASVLHSQYYDALLNGVEIFKLNNYGGNLAGPNSPQELLVNQFPKSSRSSSKKRSLIIISIGCSLSAVMLALLTFAFWIRAARGRTKQEKTCHSQSSVCRYFTMKEIKAATNNFDEAQVIGIGGFGVVYKGYIDGGAITVAIKRGNQATVEQGLSEFQAEINTLSLLRHHNVVSLMGFCNDEQEMILVYEYMPNGNLFDHLHFVNKTQKSPLSWNQRLQICTGAAQGLCYLHTGLKHPIVHRDVKTSNILLDENWIAKISDFGMSKIGPTNGSTKVKGSIGYLDPEYCRFHKLTEKSDIYSFGVVLLEVLSAKFVVNPAVSEDNYNEEDEDPETFVEWGLNCYEKGDLDQLIDKNLEGKIAPESLTKFMEIAQKCLANRGLDRPSINEVIWSLELALKLQMYDNNEDRNMGLRLMGNSDMNPGVEFSEIMIPVGR
ncbi:receptor-like protein kinase FERONIA [Ricinus communis]|uniref:receptor-like protein kinase FERONIA n=1 Tax=Ricinus communis TaxID=3988 RepID=UPI00201A7147|nr:receptor-like protein kinase FERONIA [Ricinus communis]